jgi:phosphate uptake regulator
MMVISGYQDALDLIITRPPVAGELRTIAAALNIIVDLERIGDQASDNSFRALV